MLAQDPSNGAAMSFGAFGHAALGEAHRAREWMDRAMLIDSDNLNMRYNFACMLAAHLDDRDGALRLLERYFAVVGGFQITMAEADPDLDSLRDDRRFQRMLERAKARLGIADASASAATQPAGRRQPAVRQLSAPRATMLASPMPGCKFPCSRSLPSAAAVIGSRRRADADGGA